MLEVRVPERVSPMPNFFDLRCGYSNDTGLPIVHLTWDDMDYRGGCTVREEDQYISDEGYRILQSACDAGDIDYTINDACDRFFDEIDLLTGDLAVIEKEEYELTKCKMADPLFCTDKEYDKRIRDLRWSRIIKEERKTALEKDLSCLLGRYEVPF